MNLRAFAATLVWITVAHAMGPPAMIHTKDGSVYYGELVERVETKGDEHVTLLLATGVPKRIALKDVDPSPVVLPVIPREERSPPTVTVRTKNGSAYHGELIERVVGEHVVLKLETDDVKTLDWADVDQGPLPPPRSAPHEAAPIENVYTKNGSIYHGEIVEKVMRDHVTIKLETGEVKTIEWQDMATDGIPPSREFESVLVVDANAPGAVLERREDGIFHEVCRTPCEEASPKGLYRVGGAGFVPTPPFRVGGSAHAFAMVATERTKTAGVVTTAASVAVLFSGLILGFADFLTANSNPWGHDKAPLDWATGMTVTSGAVALLVGLGMLSTASSHVSVSPR